MGPLGFFGFGVGSKQSQDTEQQFSRDQRELRDEGGGFAVNSSESVALGRGSAAAQRGTHKVIGTGIREHQQGVAGAPGSGGATNQHMGNQPSGQHASGGVYPQYGGGGGAHGHQYQQYGYGGQGHGGLQGGGQFEYGHGGHGHGGGGYQQAYRPSNPNSVGTLQAGYNRNGHPTLNAPAPPPSASAIGGYAPNGSLQSGRTGLSGGGRMDASMSSPGTERASSHEQPGGISSDAVSEDNYQAAKRGRNSGHEKNHHNNNHRVEGREDRDGRERDRNDRRKRNGSEEASGSGGQVNRQASRNPPQPRLNEEEYEFIARDIMSKPPFAGYLKYHLPVRYAARCEEVRWEWIDSNGRLCRQELIGGGKNSDLEYD